MADAPLMTVVGERVRMVGWEKRTGGTELYAGDLPVTGVLVGRILRSPHPHAEILSLDVSRAHRAPGVRAVITSADFPPGARYIHSGGASADRAPLAEHVVRYAGEEVAAVAADTAEQAARALELIDVRYRVLPAPLTIDAARAAGAARLHERPGGEPNVAVHTSGLWGDPDRGRAAPVRVEGSWWYPRVAHAVMEQNTTVARWDAERERFELWTSTQAPHFVVAELAHVFGLRPDQIVCREVAVGGGFGSKSKISEHEALAAALARASGRTVRIALTREEEFACTKPRHAFRVGLVAHADRDGLLRSLDARLEVDNGAYNHFGPSVMWVGVKTLGTMYRPDGVTWDARLIDTALAPGGQFRGYGSPQTTFAVESAMDELAIRTGIDPIDLRVKNANLSDTTTLCGARLGTVRLVECLGAVREAIGWDAKKKERRANRGVGVAAAMHGSGSYAFPGANTSAAAVDLRPDGSARVRFGGADAGTGQRTILAQIAAEELGLPYERIEVLSIDSERTPPDMGAWSSRGTHMTGHAVRQAAQGLVAQLAARGLAPRDHARLTATETFEASFTEERMEFTGSSTTPNFSASYTFAAHAVEVEVDPDTGALTILDYVAAHDIGKAINPTLVDGQIIGGVAMGLGAALGEELLYEGGQVVNPAYLNYALPRAADLPRIRPILIEEGDAAGPYGAKSIGELSVVPAAPALANAIYDAVGIRLTELPFTPDKVLAALRARDGRTARRHRLWARPDRWQIELTRRAYPLGLHRLLDRFGRRFARRLTPRPIDAVAAPATVAEAVAALGPDAVVVGGATELLPRRMQRLTAPSRLVAVGGIPALNEIGADPDGSVTIGAAVTLARLESELTATVPALAGAAAGIASAQVREAATLGGNLVQEKRCWFFRNGFECYKRGGTTCPCYAVQGDHRFFHAAVGAHRCQAVTPSDLATVLLALDAEVGLAGPAGERTLPIASFYTGPGETALADRELVARVRLPAPARRASFEKLRLWQGDFAIVSAALSARVDPEGRWHGVRVVLGALAPVPWRARATEAALEGRAATVDVLREALDRELDAAGHPLERNAWKLDAAVGVAVKAARAMGAS